jgi:hypothetical protein
MMIKLMYGLIAVSIILGGISVFLATTAEAPTEAPVIPEAPMPEEETTMCTMDAMECPDGSYVGRTGPNCEFVCPTGSASSTVPADVQAHIDAHADLIVVESPMPGATIDAPLVVTGKARGPWYFEASFPVSLVNWDGLIIAEGIATADGDWMTTDFVPFTATLNFVNPYSADQAAFMSRATLILKKDNPSGLPEHDDALEIPYTFGTLTTTP